MQHTKVQYIQRSHSTTNVLMETLGACTTTSGSREQIWLRLPLLLFSGLIGFVGIEATIVSMIAEFSIASEFSLVSEPLVVSKKFHRSWAPKDQGTNRFESRLLRPQPSSSSHAQPTARPHPTPWYAQPSLPPAVCRIRTT